MRKIRYFIFAVLILSVAASCVETNTIITYEDIIAKRTRPSTRVFVQGSVLNEWATTRAGKYGNKWPTVNVEDFWETAKFSIRIDSTIPGFENQSATKYWGGQEGPNLGKVSTLANYDTYDDRGLDYYCLDIRTGRNMGLFRYVYDPEGVLTNRVIMECPDPVEFLRYWYNKETSETENKRQLAKAIEGLENGYLKVLWYEVKEAGGAHHWYVNGVLRENTGDYEWNPNVPDEVEVDVHLQKHTDWNEIKTSIHIRSEQVTEVEVNIPIMYDNIIEQDDFNTKAYSYPFTNLEVRHNESSITIRVFDLEPLFVQYLKETFGDGVTVEVRSYCKILDSVWSEMKGTVVTTDDPGCVVRGQVTSAYDPDDKVLLE